nr:hypothetical protein [uncultured bacterium]
MDLFRTTTAAIGLLGIYLFVRGAYEASMLGGQVVLMYTTAGPNQEASVAAYWVAAEIILSIIPGCLLIAARESIARRFVMPRVVAEPTERTGSLSTVAFAIFGMYFIGQGAVTLVRNTILLLKDDTQIVHGPLMAGTTSVVLGAIVVWLAPSLASRFSERKPRIHGQSSGLDNNVAWSPST